MLIILFTSLISITVSIALSLILENPKICTTFISTDIYYTIEEN